MSATGTPASRSRAGPRARPSGIRPGCPWKGGQLGRRRDRAARAQHVRGAAMDGRRLKAGHSGDRALGPRTRASARRPGRRRAPVHRAQHASPRRQLHPGRQACGQGALAELLKRLGAAAELPEDLRHPHALRHTCATELLRAGATIADVRAVGTGHPLDTEPSQDYRQPSAQELVRDGRQGRNAACGDGHVGWRVLGDNELGVEQRSLPCYV